MTPTIDLRAFLSALFGCQRLGVLSTQSGGQPFGNLVAFAAVDDLGRLLFATGKASGKYRRLLEDPRVALLVDNRSNREADFEEAAAVTALGRARVVEGREREALGASYAARHPSLGSFVSEPECALFCVDVERYLVSGFRDVEEWVLP